MSKVIQIPIEISRESIDSVESKYPLKIVKSDRVRSAVYDNDGNLHSFCPLSSSDKEGFFSSTDELNQNVQLEEYVEGTMINVFHDDMNKEWIVCTKSNIGANNSFYINGNQKQKSFSSMFKECCESVGLELNSNYLNEKYSYSFVMRHVENRIINKITNNQLYLIAVYEKSSEVYPTHINMLFDAQSCESDWMLTRFDVKYPIVYSYDAVTKNDIVSKFAAPFTDSLIMGVNLFNKETGERAKYRNPVYEELKRLKGNQAKMEYHYMTLRKCGKVDEFLDFFPEYQEDFNMYECKIINFAHELFNRYNQCYLKRVKPLGSFDKQYKNHMFAIHEKYLEDKQRTDLDIVQNYLNHIPEAVLMGSINYEYRKERNIISAM